MKQIKILKEEILKQAKKELENNVIVDYFDFSDSLLNCFDLSEYDDFIDDNNINICDLILEVLKDNFSAVSLETTIYYFSDDRNLYDVEKDIIATFDGLEETDYETYLDYCYSIHEDLGLREYKGYCEYELKDLSVDELNELYYSDCECQDCDDKDSLLEGIKIEIDDIYEKLYKEDLEEKTLSL